MDNKKALTILLGLIAGVLMSGFIAWLTWPKYQPGTPETEVKREVFIDTITFYKPIPKDSLIIRYETRKLKTANPDSTQASGLAFTPDSIAVEIPITQKHYSDSTYQAWVSGYEPQLDSIMVYPRTELITITTSIKEKEKKKRWGLSVGAGATANTKGEIQPGIFVGITYTFIAF